MKPMYRVPVNPATAIHLEGLPDLERGWIAGIFEGEGCVSKGKSSPSLIILMTDRDILQRFHDLVGGIGVREDKYRKVNDNRRSIFSWRAHGWRNVRHFFEVIGPLLGERRRQRFTDILNQEPEWLDPPSSCGSDPTIATGAGYKAHRRRGEVPCVTCRQALNLLQNTARRKRRAKAKGGKKCV